MSEKKKCILCNTGFMMPHDYGFMLRETCTYCGYAHDIPKPDRQKEYDEWMKAKVEADLRKLEGN